MSVKLKDLQATAAIALLVMSGNLQMAGAQVAQTTTATQSSSSAAPSGGNLPAAPAASEPSSAPKLTEPLYLRDTGRDYTRLHTFFPNPLQLYTRHERRSAAAGQYSPAGLFGARREDLSEPVGRGAAGAGEQLRHCDCAHQSGHCGHGHSAGEGGLWAARGIDRAGGAIRWADRASTVTGGGGPGGTSGGSGGGGAGANGLVLSTNGGGPQPENLDPTLTSSLEYEATTTPSTSAFTGSTPVQSTTATYNFGYTQGFLTGTQLGVTFNNSRGTNTNPFNTYSPLLNTSFRATATQHLLQGFGLGDQRAVYRAGEERSAGLPTRRSGSSCCIR